MKYAIISALAAAQLCLVAGASQSDGLDAQSRAIGIILDAAERLCKNIPLYSRSNGTELSVEGKAELNAIVKKVVDAGIAGATKYEKKESQGILQTELAATLKDNTNCRMRVWHDLQAKLVTPYQGRPEPARIEQHTQGARSPNIQGVEGGVDIKYGGEGDK
ncbi:MAG: hypothetical protein LC672_05480 [Acidobacteria bacterium]|nr:hypothetical protein [Acidobacteriota bacterium]